MRTGLPLHHVSVVLIRVSVVQDYADTVSTKYCKLLNFSFSDKKDSKNMIYILVYSAALLLLAERGQANPDAKRLYENLLANYDR